MNTPECDRWGTVHAQAVAITDFVDFMQHIHNAQFAQPYMKVCWKCHGEKAIGNFNEIVCPECNGEGEISTTHLYPISKSLQDLIYDFYAIDAVKLENERRDLLENIRELNQAGSSN